MGAPIPTLQAFDDAVRRAASMGLLSVNEVMMSLAGIEGLRPANQTSRCGYCGRYGPALSQCAGCGAQVGPPDHGRDDGFAWVNQTRVIDVTHLRSDGREFIRVPENITIRK